jgi:hypothetical protein
MTIITENFVVYTFTLVLVVDTLDKEISKMGIKLKINHNYQHPQMKPDQKSGYNPFLLCQYAIFVPLA